MSAFTVPFNMILTRGQAMFKTVSSVVSEIMCIALSLLGMIELIEGQTVDVFLIMLSILMLLIGMTMGVFGGVMSQ